MIMTRLLPSNFHLFLRTDPFPSIFATHKLPPVFELMTSIRFFTPTFFSQSTSIHFCCRTNFHLFSRQINFHLFWPDNFHLFWHFQLCLPNQLPCIFAIRLTSIHFRDGPTSTRFDPINYIRFCTFTYFCPTDFYLFLQTDPLPSISAPILTPVTSVRFCASIYFCPI